MLTLRKAEQADWTAIFKMGFDVWGHSPEDDYLQDCRSSAKYAKGDWYVLESAEKSLISSLIVYALQPDHFGLGSISTVQSFRKQGFASQLIAKVIELYEQKFPKAVFFLYSDIEPAFYKRFGFYPAPQAAQRYANRVCMVRGKAPEELRHISETPEYF